MCLSSTETRSPTRLLLCVLNLFILGLLVLMDSSKNLDGLPCGWLFPLGMHNSYPSFLDGRLVAIAMFFNLWLDAATHDQTWAQIRANPSAGLLKANHLGVSSRTLPSVEGADHPLRFWTL